MRKAFATLFMMSVAACAVTEQDKSATVDKTTASAFLKDEGQLRPGKKDQALLVYFNPNADWRKYNKVMIDPVTVGLGPEHQVSEQDQQMLSSYYHNKMEEDLATRFTIVQQPGPDVMRVRAALTDATTATPVLRTISVVIPQARILGAAKNLATGTYAFVGAAQSEGEVLDSMTGERLAAAVDRRSGGISVKNAGVWEWGDAEHAMDHWAQRMALTLGDLHEGKQASAQ
jgi:Protein of unknown function (DUF3313)